jgi:hypothetical protein
MKIYVIIGSTGEYSDHSEWPVCWRSTLAEAEQVVAVCNAEAAAFKRWMDDDQDHLERRYGKAFEEYRAKMLDPSCTVDYTGTTYLVWVVCEDPREDAKEQP